VTLPVEDLGRCAFPVALDRMGYRLDRMQRGIEGGHVIVFESYPVITLGRDARRANLLVGEGDLLERGVRVVKVDRGGDATWHGPGQLVMFPLVDLRRRGWDVYRFVDLLIDSVATTLAHYGISIDPPEGAVGVWVRGEKIASIGLRHRRGIVSHGISLNVNPSFEWFDFINPCGDRRHRVTSLHKLLDPCPDLESVKAILLDRFNRRLRCEELGTGSDGPSRTAPDSPPESGVASYGE